MHQAEKGACFFGFAAVGVFEKGYFLYLISCDSLEDGSYFLILSVLYLSCKSSTFFIPG